MTTPLHPTPDETNEFPKVTAPAPTYENRWQEIRMIWLQHRWLYWCLGVLSGLTIQPLLSLFSVNVQDALVQLSPSLISALIVIGSLHALNRRHTDRLERERHRSRLLEWIRRGNSDIATMAVQEMREYGLLYGEEPLLKGQYLLRVNFQETVLDNAILEHANLTEANLFKTQLWGADLREALLIRANLSQAMLIHADLRGANLTDANLYRVHLWGALLNEFTILPDGSYWSTQTDLSRFINPMSPYYWRSQNPDSPAYLWDDTQ
ncbi:MAG: pentapeptide repeat-containing protein [Phototrophicaceae bacterium]